MKYSYCALIFSLQLFISSCCTKKDCDAESNDIRLENFAAQDIDSIAVEIYESNSNFTNRLDSSFKVTYFTQYDSSFHISINENLNKEHDYKITMLSNGNTYTITDFETSKEKCNDCFPYHPASDYYDVLTGYTINGQKQVGDIITIVK